MRRTWTPRLRPSWRKPRPRTWTLPRLPPWVSLLPSPPLVSAATWGPGKILGGYAHLVMLRTGLQLAGTTILETYILQNPEARAGTAGRLGSLLDAWLAERARWAWLREPSAADFGLFLAHVKYAGAGGDAVKAFARFLAVPESEPAYVQRGNYLLQSAAAPAEYIFAAEEEEEEEAGWRRHFQ